MYVISNLIIMYNVASLSMRWGAKLTLPSGVLICKFVGARMCLGSHRSIGFVR